MKQLSLQDCHWPIREPDSHKGLHGSLAVIGGAEGMLGAALLAARAGLLAGAGRSYLAPLQKHAPQVDMRFPELMMRSPEQVMLLNQLDCLAIGPGLGQSHEALAILRQTIQSPFPLVLDADALNLIASENLSQLIAHRSAGCVITPHAGEAARLLHCSAEQIQSQREQSAKTLAKNLNCVCVLKGAQTLIASPQGDCVMNPTGNVGLASGGTGDVLCGIVASLMAQGHNAWQAATTATYLHGLAADQLVQQGIGPIGLRASEVATQVRYILNHHE